MEERVSLWASGVGCSPPTPGPPHLLLCGRSGEHVVGEGRADAVAVGVHGVISIHVHVHVDGVQGDVTRVHGAVAGVQLCWGTGDTQHPWVTAALLAAMVLRGTEGHTACRAALTVRVGLIDGDHALSLGKKVARFEMWGTSTWHPASPSREPEPPPPLRPPTAAMQAQLWGHSVAAPPPSPHAHRLPGRGVVLEERVGELHRHTLPVVGVLVLGDAEEHGSRVGGCGGTGAELLWQGSGIHLIQQSPAWGRGCAHLFPHSWNAAAP